MPVSSWTASPDRRPAQSSASDVRAALTVTVAVLAWALLSWGLLCLITYVAMLPIYWAAHLIGAL